MRFEHVSAAGDDAHAILREYLPAADDDFALTLVPSALAAELSAEDDRTLRGWKMLCDELLPGLRSRSHLHNLIRRSKHNWSLILSH